MPSDRKFYRTVIELEVLSDQPLGQFELETIVYEITEGSWSGVDTIVLQEEVSEGQLKELLIAQGSDPEFMLNDSDFDDDDIEYIDITA
jgi:hypothetical protein